MRWKSVKDKISSCSKLDRSRKSFSIQGLRVRELRGVQIILTKSDTFDDQPKRESIRCKVMCLNECDEVLQFAIWRAMDLPRTIPGRENGFTVEARKTSSLYVPLQKNGQAWGRDARYMIMNWKLELLFLSLRSYPFSFTLLALFTHHTRFLLTCTYQLHSQSEAFVIQTHE